MNLIFNNSQTLSITKIKEEKRIYSAPEKWELTITSNEDLTSDELDNLLCLENISLLRYGNGTGNKTLIGYNTVDFVSKQIDESGALLKIVLLKEVTENENQVQE